MNKYYPYELHCHTNHSDGDMSPCELVQKAKSRGYTGIAITDHNTISSVDEVVYWGERYGIKVLKGIEWTTFWGHLTAIGGDNNVDWREISQENIDEIIKRASESGTLITIAHPKRNGSPLCTGCHMDLPITKYEYINAIEVWTQKNPHLGDYNKKAIEYYDGLLNTGYKLAAVYGHDWHREDKKERAYATTFIGGNPDNCIESLRKGDTFVSLGLYIMASIDAKNIPFSSEIKAGEHTFEISIKEFNADFCSKYGITPKKYKLTGSSLKSEIEKDINQPVTVKLNKGYIRIEIKGSSHDSNDCLLLITSPYYVI